MHELYVRIQLKLIERIVDIGTYKNTNTVKLRLLETVKIIKIYLLGQGIVHMGAIHCGCLKLLDIYYATKHFHNNQ